MLVCLAATAVAPAQVATKLIAESEFISSSPYPITALREPFVNHAGGYAVQMTTSRHGAFLDFVWGSVDGVVPPDVLQSSGSTGSVSLAWLAAPSMSDTGQIACRVIGSAAGSGTVQGLFIDDAAVHLEGEALPPGTLSRLYWANLDYPEITADGSRLFFAGDSAESPDGPAVGRGLFVDDGTALLYTGDLVPGLPPVGLADASSSLWPLFDISRSGTHYLTRVHQQAEGPWIPGYSREALVFDGAALMAGGGAVQSGQLVPAAAGGVSGHRWNSFRNLAVNDAGETLFTGNTRKTIFNAVVVINGVIVARQGAWLDGHLLSSYVRGASMNENGDWAVFWSHDDPDLGEQEILIFNGEVVLSELDEVDVDGDGIADPGAVVTGFPRVGYNHLALGDRQGGEVPIYFGAYVNDGGAGNVQGLYRMMLPVASGKPGDLSLEAIDAPDPVPVVGEPVVYTLLVRNRGLDPATGITVETVLDRRLRFDAPGSGPSASHDGSETGGTVTSAIDEIPPQEARIVTVSARTTQLGTVTTTHRVSADRSDPDASNDVAVSTTDVSILADLSLVVADAPEPVLAQGGPLRYRVEVTNFGPSAATGVTVTLALDETTSFVSAASDPVAVHDGSPTGGVVTAALDSLPPNAIASFEVEVAPTTQAVLMLEAAVTGHEADPVPASNSQTETTVYEPTANVAMVITDGPDPVPGPGGSIAYLVEVSNDGPGLASSVTATVDLDPSTSFQSADPPAVHDGGRITAELGELAAGATAVFTVTVDAPVAGRPEVVGSVVNGGPQIDPDGADNATIVSTLVLDDSACGVPTVIFSDLAGSPTSAVPGLAGVKFTRFLWPAASPSGTHWAVSAVTDQNHPMHGIILVKRPGLAPAVAVQTGVTSLELGDRLESLDADLSINDVGQFAFAANTDAPHESREVIVKWDGAQFVTVARRGQPAVFGSYPQFLHGPRIVADGSVWFQATGDDDEAQADEAVVLADDGATVVLRSGIDAPSDQAGGETVPWDAFVGRSLAVDAHGTSYLIAGWLASGDMALAVDNVAVAQDGVPLAGSDFTSPASLLWVVPQNTMTASGDWVTRGQNADGVDWIVANGSVVAATGRPVASGLTEAWTDESYQGFFAATAGPDGHHVAGGTTSSGEAGADSALVLDGRLVVLRENDPVDVDGNGVLDDDVRIAAFVADGADLTAAGELLVSVSLRSGDGSPAPIGDALIGLDVSCLLAGLPPAAASDGSQSTDPLRMTRLEPSGSTLAFWWDAASCTSPDYAILAGPLGSVDGYDLIEAACGTGVWGSHVWKGVPAGDLYFIVVGRDHADAESSWGAGSSGVERNGPVASGLCGARIKEIVDACP